MNKIKLIKENMEKAKATLRNSQDELTEAHKNRFLLCVYCNKKSKVNRCSGIDYHYWDENTGSPCGGYYVHGYYAWKCPNCGNYKRNEFKDEKLFWEMHDAFKNHKKLNRKSTW